MKKLIFNFAFLLIVFMVVPINLVLAQEDGCDKSTVSVVFRDGNGEFVPDINFEIYSQVNDVDGLPKPEKKVASGKTSAVTGRGVVSFTSDYLNFAIKAWDKSKEEGVFYFYDSLQVCGGETEVENDLSAINISFRDTAGKLIKNQNFSLYTQRHDADGNPIKEKQDLVTSQSTSEEGEMIIYVSDSSTSIDGRGTDYYVIEAKDSSDGGVYRKFDTRVSGGSTSEVSYIFSDVVFTVKDKKGISFPAGEKIAVYKQTLDDEGNSALGNLVKEIYTNDKGVAILRYPEGVYAVRLVGENNQNLDFFDIEIFENKRSEYALSPDNDWTPTQGACDLQSNLTINTKNIAGEVLGGVKYELYEQELDINGIPTATLKVMDGEVDILGHAIVLFNPDPRKQYALKLYVHNEQVGEFWYFNELQFACGEDTEITKKLPTLKIILRQGDNSLVKNKKFSLYTQKFDVDGFPIKEKKDLVANTFTTSEEGAVEIHVSGDHLFDKEKRGTYVLEVIGENKKQYLEYGINIENNQDTVLEYIFSDIVIELKQANGQPMINKELTIYNRQFDQKGGYSLGDKQLSVVTNDSGKARFPLPVGFYVLNLEDSFGNDINFWNIRVADKKRKNKTLIVNTTKVIVHDKPNSSGLANEKINVYSLKENSEGKYERDKKLKYIKTGAGGYRDLILASNPYLFVALKDKKEYGLPLYADNKKFQQLDIILTNANLVSGSQHYNLIKPVIDIPMSEKLAGRILLQVEGRGEAWYVDGDSHRRYYMKNGPTAYEMMRKFGLGISNNNLEKIPIGLDERFEEFDYDGDLVPDKMEEAIGTDMYNSDSDGDGFEDGEEIQNGFNPSGAGVLDIDPGLANKLKGKILLQVESRGEAWYVHPENGKRYYMKDGESAYEIMRFLSLGITDENLEEIEAGSLAE